MAKGIIAKIWNIKEGSLGRSAGVQIKDSVRYITDPLKCDEHLKDSKGQLGRELTYVTNDVKTLEGLYTGSRHILDIKNSSEEMMQIKLFHGKTGGRVALHGVISVDESESDKKNAGKLMCLADDLLKELFPDNQAVYAVHTNTENLHVHFIVNTVSLSGKKIHMDKNFMKGVFEPALNRLAQKYGFTPNESWKPKKQIPYGEILTRLRQLVDEAIERTESFDDLLKDLKGSGITVNAGKYLSLKMDGMTHPVRSFRLGSAYSLEKITERLLTKREELLRSEVGDHLGDVSIPAAEFLKKTTLKKYKEMDPEEKARCIKLLKKGRNPWKEQSDTNWRIEKLSQEFARTANVYELIRTYAPLGNATDALDEIVKRQKEVAAEKKQVKETLRAYSQVIKLYKQCKDKAKKAYLYEVFGEKEYLADFLEYKSLSERLEKGYSKTVIEVADFLEDQECQLLYAGFQSQKLSEEYKTILRFRDGELKRSSEYISLYDATGFSKARERARSAGVYESSVKYIAAEGADEAYIRVVTTPDIRDGKPSVSCTLSVFDANGKKISEITSPDMNIRDFNKSLSELKNRYGFFRCHVFDEKTEAQDFALKQKDTKKRVKTAD